MVAPAEATLLADVQASGLLHADETSWPQQQQRLVAVGVHHDHHDPVCHCWAGQGHGHARAGRLYRLADERWLVSYRGLSAPPALLGAPAAQSPRAGGVLRSRWPRLRSPGAHHAGNLDGAIYAAREGPPPDGAAVDLPRAYAQASCDLLRRAADGASQSSPCQDPGAGGGTPQRLGRHLPRCSSIPELPLTNNAAERALAPLGHRPPPQPWHPHRRRLPRLYPAGQCHRHLSATRPLALELPGHGDH